MRTFRKYGVMLPFNGTTLHSDIANISELLPDLWWIDILHHTELHGIRVLKFPFLRRNRADILKEINV
jgi:hypothetical protein